MPGLRLELGKVVSLELQKKQQFTLQTRAQEQRLHGSESSMVT